MGACAGVYRKGGRGRTPPATTVRTLAFSHLRALSRGVVSDLRYKRITLGAGGKPTVVGVGWQEEEVGRDVGRPVWRLCYHLGARRTWGLDLRW